MADDPTPTSRLRRSTRLGGLVAGQSARIAGGRLLDQVRGDEARERAQAKRTADIVEQVVIRLGEMKGAAMKIGQVLSTVEFPGLPEEDAERIRRRLGALRDQAPRVPWARLEKLMASEWGEPVARVLDDVEPEAMAAASIGQVHRARTRDGHEVVIKVQYPGIAEAVEADLRNLRLLMPLIGRLAPQLDTKALADELRERISEELDYELEAASQRRLQRWWRGHPHVVVPRVMTDISTRRVLVTERLEGLGFDDLRGEPEAVRDRVAEIVHRFYYATAKEHDVALGDPHPGNWQLLPDGRAVVFDYGMVRTLPHDYLVREAPVVRALRAEDGIALRDALAALGYLGRDPSAFDPELLLLHMSIAAHWQLVDEQPYRLSSEIQRGIAEDLMRLGPEWRRMVRNFSFPPEAMLLRRMGDLLFVAFCQLRAAADWWALSSELQLGEAPATELGREHAAWRDAR